MRYALFGDIHGNLEALQAVMEKTRGLEVNEIYCLGDIVGYGADPEECASIVRDVSAGTVAGNHDHAAIGRLDISYFNQYARDAAIWTQNHLSDETKRWLNELPFVRRTAEFSMVHGSLHHPELFNYVQTLKDAEFNFHAMETMILFLGHSHQPLGFFNTDPMTYTLESTIPLEAGVKTIINIGSVGQPRDEDPRACFAVYDSEKHKIKLHRVEYDIGTAARKIVEAGLPEALALRLSLGK